jgi:hypothetical protein
MAFMFETRYPQQLTRYAAELETLQDNYLECWDGLERKFDGTRVSSEVDNRPLIRPVGHLLPAGGEKEQAGISSPRT